MVVFFLFLEYEMKIVIVSEIVKLDDGQLEEFTKLSHNSLVWKKSVRFYSSSLLLLALLRSNIIQELDLE